MLRLEALVELAVWRFRGAVLTPKSVCHQGPVECRNVSPSIHQEQLSRLCPGNPLRSVTSQSSRKPPSFSYSPYLIPLQGAEIRYPVTFFSPTEFPSFGGKQNKLNPSPKYQTSSYLQRAQVQTIFPFRHPILHAPSRPIIPLHLHLRMCSESHHLACL